MDQNEMKSIELLLNQDGPRSTMLRLAWDKI